jgi:glycosyltransferase involved in cell wall biosynthesis
MRVMWICGLPKIVQDQALNAQDHGAQATWSWIVAHLPPPTDIELNIACLWPGGDRTKSFEFGGATFHLLPCPRRGRALSLFLWDTQYFKDTFLRLQPDLVHGWGTEDSFGLVARRLARFRHVIEIQGLTAAGYRYFPRTYRTRLVRFTERLTLKDARYVVAESHFAVEAAADLCPIAKKFVIEQPLRHHFLEAQPSRGTNDTALFVGTIRDSKGIFDAITAFSKMSTKDWRLHVIGSGTKSDENRMRHLVANSDIADRFEHSRQLPVDDLVKAMQRASILLLPSRIDSGPTALKEALIMGLWPICYDNSGPKEYIRKYQFGSLARNLNLDSLVEEMDRALTLKPWQNPAKREELARVTRQHFSRGKAWQELTALYKIISEQLT